MNNISKLINSWKTVFTKNDIRKILDFSSSFALDKFIQRAKENKIIESLYYWIYWFKNYNIFEFACKLKKTSYISFETVLQKSWIIFQDYSNTIYLASDDTFQKQTIWKTFQINKIKNNILLNPLGVENKRNYIIASKERAVCDRIYLSKNYYFDNLEILDFEKLEKISKIYNKRVILEVKKIIDNVK
mgnify:CR=1 FL=1